MFTIMIVDDEKAIRENLPGIINFEEYGFKICGAAKNGRDALEKLPQCRPDVIFLDVCMPVMDGLAFLQEIHKMPEEEIPCVVMLSGYSDFEYARSAMRYGVKAYLTKPVDEEETGLILAELKEVLKEKSQNRRRDDVQEQVKALKNVYHSGDGDRAAFLGCWMLHCAVLQQEGSGEEGWCVVRKVMDERISGGEAAFCRNQGSIFSYLIGPETLKDYQQNVTLFARHLLHRLRQRGMECALLFDREIFEKAQGTFRNDYDAHLYQMLTEVFWKREAILQSHTLDLSDFPESRLEKEEEYLAEIKKAIRGRDTDRLRKIYESMVEAAWEKGLSIVFLQELNYRIYYGLSDLLSRENITNVRISPLDIRSGPCFMCAQDWKEALWQQISEVYTCMEKRGMAGGGQGVGEQALAYIRSHFREPISLQSVADQLFVSVSYLSRCLQKSLGGGNFRQYINDLRVEEAKRLLRETDKLIYEIAQETGFTESKYFISKFIDQMGMSPMEYRKMEKEKSNICTQGNICAKQV